MLSIVIINTISNAMFYFLGVATVYVFANKSKPIEVDKQIFHKEPKPVDISDLYPDEEAFVPEEENRNSFGVERRY